MNSRNVQTGQAIMDSMKNALYLVKSYEFGKPVKVLARDHNISFGYLYKLIRRYKGTRS